MTSNKEYCFTGCAICNFPNNATLIDSTTKLDDINNVIFYNLGEDSEAAANIILMCRDCIYMSRIHSREDMGDISVNDYVNELRDIVNAVDNKVFIFPVHVSGRIRYVKLHSSDIIDHTEIGTYRSLFNCCNIKLFHTSQNSHTLKTFVHGMFNNDVLYGFLKQVKYLNDNNLYGYTIMCDEDYNIKFMQIADTVMESLIQLDDESNC